MNVTRLLRKFSARRGTFFVTAVALFYVVRTCLALYPTTIHWTEDVLLPTGEVILATRQITFLGVGDRAIWHSERTDFEYPPLSKHFYKWESSRDTLVSTVGLYFENGVPRIITTDLDLLPANLFGCSFSKRHRQFLLQPDGSWKYDPFSKVTTHYSGPTNLISSIYLKGMQELLTAQNNHVTHKEKWAAQIIDPINEDPTCEVYDPDFKQKLANVLAHKRD